MTIPWIAFLGPPGSGKTTQALILSNREQFCYLSLGILIREAAASGTLIGTEIRALISSDEVIPDDLILRLIEMKVASSISWRGFVLDGFPRTLGQAKLLDVMLARQRQYLSAVIRFDVPVENLNERLSGRLVHQKSQRVYNQIFAPPQSPGFDDLTFERLSRRNDDLPEVLSRRLPLYLQHEQGISDHYASIVFTIDGTPAIPLVADRIQVQIDPLMSENRREYPKFRMISTLAMTTIFILSLIIGIQLVHR